jgi:hypothetical protein
VGAVVAPARNGPLRKAENGLLAAAAVAAPLLLDIRAAHAAGARTVCSAPGCLCPRIAIVVHSADISAGRRLGRCADETAGLACERHTWLQSFPSQLLAAARGAA